MITVVFLVLTLSIVLGLALYSSYYIVSPEILFTGGFLLQAFFCIFYVDQWAIDLNFKTLVTVAGGCILFFVIECTFCNKKIHSIKIKGKDKKIEARRTILFVFLAIQIIATIGYIKFMNDNMTGASIAEKIYAYRQATADYGKNIPIPKYLSLCRLFSSAAGYVISYIYICNICVYKKLHQACSGLMLAVMVMSCVLEGILGARGGILNFIIAIVIEYALVEGKMHSNKLRLIKKIILCAVIVMTLMPVFGKIMGRPIIENVFYEMAVYVGAPLKNLDIFLAENANLNKIHYSTFSSALADLTKILSIKQDSTSYVFPGHWNFINGYNLGNVYTAFANYWYDFGIVGFFFYTVVEAMIIGRLFSHAIDKRKLIGTKEHLMSTVLYAYFATTILFSFFGNRFYEQFFSLYTIKFIVMLMIVCISMEYRISNFIRS